MRKVNEMWPDLQCFRGLFTNIDEVRICNILIIRNIHPHPGHARMCLGRRVVCRKDVVTTYSVAASSLRAQ